MRFVYRYGCLTLLVLLLCVLNQVFSRELKVRRIASGAEIPSSYITSVEQLSNGLILFGTQSGAHLYDGRRIFPLMRTNDVTSPVNANIYDTLEDHKKHIWLASDKGLFQYDPETSSVVRHQANPDNSKSISNNNVRYIVESSDKRIWFATLDGLAYYSHDSKTFTNIWLYENQQKVSMGRVYRMREDSRGIIWIASTKGLFKLPLNGNTITRQQGEVGKHYFTSILEVNDDEMWFGADEKGLYIYKVSDDTFTLHTQSDSHIPLVSNNIWALHKDSQGLIWIGYWTEGVSVFDPVKRRSFRIKHRTKDDTALPGTSIERITHDRSGLVWIATTEGAATFDPALFQIDNIGYTPGTEFSINDSKVLNIYEDNERIAWLATENGLEKWNVERDTVEHFYHDPNDKNSISKGAIWKVSGAGNQYLVLATDKGVEVFDKKSEQFTLHNTFTYRDGTRVNVAFYSLGKVSDSLFYLGTSAATVHSFNPFTGDHQLVFDSTQYPESLELEYFNVILPDKGAIWLGSTTGLYYWKPNIKTLKKFNTSTKGRQLTGNIIFDIEKTPDGSLWVATSSGGINHIKNPESDAPIITIIDKNAGMPSNDIRSVFAYDDALWFTTPEHFGKLDKTSYQITIYPLLSAYNESFTEASRFVGSNGNIYLGGSEAFRFNPNDLSLSSLSPNVMVTGVNKLYQPVKDFNVLKAGLPLDVAPQDSLISIEFASLDLAYPEHIKYRYKLLGYDKNWLSPGNESRAYYTNLPPGSYRFLVEGTNRSGLWSANYAELPIIVHPPLWRTWYAYLFYIAVASIILFFIIQEKREKRRRELASIRAIKKSEARLKDVLWGSGDELWRWDLKAQKIYRTTILNHDDSTEETVEDIDSLIKRVHPEDQEKLLDTINLYVNAEIDSYETQFRVLNKNGNDWRWVMSKGRVVEVDEHGKPVMLAGTRKDITDLKKTESQLRYLANYDQLTQLPNRSLFKEHLNHAIQFAKRYNEKIALLFFDLDGFKIINDSMGHGVGDQLLQAVASRLRRILRGTDNIARLGGDEFTVIIERIKTREEIVPTIERVIHELAKPFEIGQQTVATSASVGISMYPEDGETYALLLKHADIAMYEAKRSGKNHHRYFEPEMNALLVKRLDMEQEITVALRNNDFETFFQPRVCVKTNTIKSFEALIRWRHPERGLVSPAEFIPVAEETGQILNLGDWVLQDACKQCAQWQQAGNDVVVSVNIAAMQFQQADIIESVQEALNKTGLPPEKLELEITESTLIKDIEHTRSVLLRLKKLGLKIALDDFGTGYSSLAYLQQLPIDILKIDRSFINQVIHSKKAAQLCRSIIHMAHSLNLEVVAEGIEESLQLAFLKDADCEEYQGFLFDKPKPASEILFDKHVPSQTVVKS